MPYSTIFGGVGGLTLAQMEKTNGFSNMFWGWGGEDDDMYNRFVLTKAVSFLNSYYYEYIALQLLVNRIFLNWFRKFLNWFRKF